MNYDFNHAIKVFQNAVTGQFWDVGGRTSRRNFWHYISITFLISIILNLLTLVPVIGYIIGLVGMVVSLALLAPGIGMAVRRMHDIDQPWFMMLIPFYNIYLACQPGTKGVNKFGPDPLI
jgi:uncharacterized membrane protein YhaH (DUF805 family)